MRLYSRPLTFRLLRPAAVVGGTLMAVVLVPAIPAQAACSPVLKGLTVPKLAYAGDKATGTVSLSCAPRTKVKVLLSTDQRGLTVPSSVTVSARRSTAKVPLTAKSVAGPQYKARVTGRYKGRARTGDITVNPGLKKVVIPESSSPNSVSVEALFTGPAPTGGLTVRVKSDNPAVTVSPTSRFQVGAVGGDITGIQVHRVTKDTKVTISVSLGSRTLRASKVLLRPFDGTQGMSIHAGSSGDVYGLEFDRDYHVSINNPAPESGLEVQMKLRGDTSAVRLQNTSDFISEGGNSASFRLDTADVTKTSHVVLEATVLGATARFPLTIHPRITAVTLPETVKSGTPFRGTITLAGPSDVDTKIFLQASWGILQPQDEVTIPAGHTSATFEATSVAVDEPSRVFVTAYLGSNTVSSDYVTLTP